MSIAKKSVNVVWEQAERRKEERSSSHRFLQISETLEGRNNGGVQVVQLHDQARSQKRKENNLGGENEGLEERGGQIRNGEGDLEGEEAIREGFKRV